MAIVLFVWRLGLGNDGERLGKMGGEMCEWPPFIGRDGEYYCKEHILPEKREMVIAGKPPMDFLIFYFLPVPENKNIYTFIHS